MTLGRPPSMRDIHRVPLPSPIDDRYLSLANPSRAQPPDIFSTNQFCVENTKLAKLLAEILETVYHPRAESVHRKYVSSDVSMPEHSFDTIVALGMSLEDVANDLPPRLHWSRNQNLADVAPVIQRQSNVLHAR